MLLLYIVFAVLKRPTVLTILSLQIFSEISIGNSQLHAKYTWNENFTIFEQSLNTPIGKVWIYRLLFVCVCVCVCLYGYGFIRRG